MYNRNTPFELAISTERVFPETFEQFHYIECYGPEICLFSLVFRRKFETLFKLSSCCINWALGPNQIDTYNRKTPFGPFISTDMCFLLKLCISKQFHNISFKGCKPYQPDIWTQSKNFFHWSKFQPTFSNLVMRFRTAPFSDWYFNGNPKLS